MKKRADMPESVQLADWPSPHPEYIDVELAAKWESLLELRGEITKALEISRRNKDIGNSLDAALTVYADGSAYETLQAVLTELPNYFIVSAVELKLGTDNAPTGSFRSETLPVSVVVTPSSAEKCERCWIHEELTSAAPDESGLCKRCAGVMAKSGI
jgi:isoleucyl-tRNA synthetase